MSITLRQNDFTSSRNGGMDMWSALVEAAIASGILPAGTKSDDVEELVVRVVK